MRALLGLAPAAAKSLAPLAGFIVILYPDSPEKTQSLLRRQTDGWNVRWSLHARLGLSTGGCSGGHKWGRGSRTGAVAPLHLPHPSPMGSQTAGGGLETLNQPSGRLIKQSGVTVGLLAYAELTCAARKSDEC